VLLLISCIIFSTSHHTKISTLVNLQSGLLTYKKDTHPRQQPPTAKNNQAQPRNFLTTTNTKRPGGINVFASA
jgi:hypothetical protein